MIGQKCGSFRLYGGMHEFRATTYACFWMRPLMLLFGLCFYGTDRHTDITSTPSKKTDTIPTRVWLTHFSTRPSAHPSTRLSCRFHLVYGQYLSRSRGEMGHTAHATCRRVHVGIAQALTVWSDTQPLYSILKPPLCNHLAHVHC